jgi:O-antigen biosynthesis protein
VGSRHPSTICIGVYAAGDLERRETTLASLRARTVARADLLLLPGEAGAPASFNRLAAGSDARVLVLLEGGAVVGQGWLSTLLAALDNDPRNGLAGPSTNRSGNNQAIFHGCDGTADAVATTATRAARSFGSGPSALVPLESLADFCFAVRREVVEAVGLADESLQPERPWEIDYAARAARAGFRAVWARGAFVCRAPPETRRPASGPPDAGAAERPRPLRSRLPLVSCIMPTRDRPEFALRAIEYFLRQTYPSRELVVVDDGEEGLADRLPRDPRIRYVRSPHQESLGAKRNRACALARGTLVAHWDDDDWYAPARLAAQAEPILEGRADMSGLAGTRFVDLERWQTWSCTPELHRRLFVADVNGGTLVYERRVWEHLSRFPDDSLAEDAVFLKRALRRGARLASLPSAALFLYVRHAGNSWSFACGEHLDPAGWILAGQPRFPRADRAFYAARSAAARPRARRRSAAGAALVSCIMPTFNRRAYVPQAIRYFLRQDYPNRELIVVDDGSDPVADLIPADPRIRYVAPADHLVLGEKRNRACELAEGEIIVHWDDDDWSAPHRLSYQVAELERHGADVCGTRRELFYDAAAGRAWLFEYPPRVRRRLAGNTLCYRKQVWGRRPFAPLAVGEDARFLHSSHARNAIALDDHRFCVGIVHAANTSPKITTAAGWRPYPAGDVRRLLRADLSFYEAATASLT